MTLTELLLLVVHVLVALAACGVLAWGGRHAARRLGQPLVVGEIVAGMLGGPVLAVVLGVATFRLLMPAAVLSALKFVTEIGLVLFLVGLAHKLRTGPTGGYGRTVGWVAFGGFVPSAAGGVVLAGWILLTGGGAVRGHSPTPAFVVFLAVAMATSAVPVLARILADRGMADTSVGRLAVAAAVVMDTVGWLLLSIAVGLNTGSQTGFMQATAVLGGGAAVALGIRAMLRTDVAAALCARLPRFTAVLLAIVTLAVAFTVERLGLTSILGAILVGLAVPSADGWATAVAAVSRIGRALVPIFFVVTGVAVLTSAFSAAPWTVIVVATGLAIVSKIGGGYLGARLGGKDRADAARVGALMNTRGLTELVVIQAGYGTGIVAGPLYLALVVMAVVTTAMTGPLLTLVDRVAARRPAPVAKEA